MLVVGGSIGKPGLRRVLVTKRKHLIHSEIRIICLLAKRRALTFMNKTRHMEVRAQRAGHPNQISMIEVGQTRLRVAIRPGNGKGLPLLLMNGIGANLEMLDPFVDALDLDLEIIRFDVPGVGGSPATLLPHSMMSLASLTTEMLDHLNTSPYAAR